MTPNRIIEAAKNSATTRETRNRLEEITSYPGYVEPGYSDPKEGIYLSNWNAPSVYDPVRQCRVEVEDGDIIPRLKNALEAVGANTEWSDEWTFCHDCSCIGRTISDGYGWKPSLVINLTEGSCLCKDCHEAKLADS